MEVECIHDSGNVAARARKNQSVRDRPTFYDPLQIAVLGVHPASDQHAPKDGSAILQQLEGAQKILVILEWIPTRDAAEQNFSWRAAPLRASETMDLGNARDICAQIRRTKRVFQLEYSGPKSVECTAQMTGGAPVNLAIKPPTRLA